MCRIEELSNRLGSVVEGQYSLSQSSARLSRNGERYQLLNFADATGNQLVFVWERSGLLESVNYLAAPTPVQAQLYLRVYEGDVVADLRSIRAVESHEVENAAMLLSLEDCPVLARPALADLARFTDSIDCLHLREFLNRVLLDDRVSERFLTCRASQSHHHSEPGGLLVHSMEVLSIVTRIALGRLTDTECEISQVAAVLHDLGKIRSVGSGHVRPVAPKIVSHETQTNRLLEYHLEWLKARVPRTGAALEYIFSFLAQPTATRGYALFVGADIVAYSDRISTAIARGKTVDYLLTGTSLAADHKRAFHDNQKVVASIPW